MNDRKYWLKTLDQIALPVLTALSEKKLKERMPVEAAPGITDRPLFTHLEAFGRIMTGIAPWLECTCSDPEEEKMRQKYVRLAQACLDAATDPASPDFMNFTFEYQPIVDTAFLANGILRAPTVLWKELEPRVQANIINAFKATRTRKPAFSNWLMFSAIIEAALYMMGDPTWDKMRIDYALNQHQQWYVGGGMYSDGPHFSFDYYNSFVIQPMMVDILNTVGDVGEECEGWGHMRTRVMERSSRYAHILEMLISPEGTYPLVGRSITYRFGAFQSLAQMALLEQLPEQLSPEQVRCALTAVIKRTMDSGIFDENGWLKIGVCGAQPSLGEPYISTGSLYLCCAVFLPLGLPAEHPFWSGDEKPWSSKKAWSGIDMPADHGIA